MKKFLLLIAIFIGANASGQIKNLDDSLCLENTKQSKADYEKGQLKFCINATWDLPFARMYDILDSLCKRTNVTLTPYPYTEHDYGFDPYSCYSAFMDSIIKKKYGSNFKNDLCNLADSLFKARHINDTIPAYYCDTRPTYFKKMNSLEKDFFKNFSLPDSCVSLFNCTTCDYRVIFLVDLNGHASNYKIYHTDSLNRCDNRVDKAIIDALQKIDQWRPGILGNRKVVSYGDLLINFPNRRII